jgi:hypothetical protein
MKRAIFPLLAALASLVGCSKDDDPNRDIITGEDKIATIEQAKTVLARQHAGGVLVKTSVPLTDRDPGGWRVEFTGGSPATLDLMNGSDAVSGLTPKLVVRHNADGSTTLWLNEGDGLVETRTTLTGPFGSEITPAAAYTPPMLDVRRGADGVLTVWYNPDYGYPDEGWKDTGVKLRAGSGTGSEAAQGPRRAIIDNEARGTVTIWLNDDEHTNYTFEKFSPAIRFNIMNDDVEILEGETVRLLFVVSSSEAWIPPARASGSTAGNSTTPRFRSRRAQAMCSPAPTARSNASCRRAWARASIRSRYAAISRIST